MLASTDRQAVPRGRDAKPLELDRQKSISDDGSGWVFGILILGVIGILTFTYMPKDHEGRPSGETPEARPGDLPGQAWNPQNQTLRGSKEPASTPTSAPTPQTPGTRSKASAASPPPELKVTGSGTVRVAGTASKVTLIGQGQRLPPGKVPAGNYRVEAVFKDGQVVKAGRIQVLDGSLQTLYCSGVKKTCSAE